MSTEKMISLQQLKYFVVSADVGSFSEAAKILYTTQSNISKSIMLMEEQLGCRVFERKARGIELTARGKQIYKYAEKVMDDMEMLQETGAFAGDRSLSIASNPSSWFAKVFTEFYREHQAEDIHYRVHTCSTDEVLERVRDARADLGFVFAFRDEWDAFTYRLKRNRLCFKVLREVKGMLYIGKKHPLCHRNTLTLEEAEKLKYIQMEQDSFASQEGWKMEGDVLISSPNTSVVTNSDYIMRTMLDEAEVVNISAESFYGQEGIVLDNEKGNAVFGCICRMESDGDGEEIPEEGEQFISFVQKKLENR